MHTTVGEPIKVEGCCLISDCEEEMIEHFFVLIVFSSLICFKFGTLFIINLAQHTLGDILMRDEILGNEIMGRGNWNSRISYPINMPLKVYGRYKIVRLRKFEASPLSNFSKYFSVDGCKI